MGGEDLKKEIAAITLQRKKLRAAALRVYLDPIDFPYEVKSNLRRLSRKKLVLQNILKSLKNEKSN